MGILDDLKHNLEKLGDKAKEGLDDVRDKAGDLVDDAKERFGHESTTPLLTESSDVGPDSSSTDAVQPGYVTAEDDVTEDSDEASLEAELDADDDPDAAGSTGDPVVEEENLVAEPSSSDVVPPAAAELDPVDLDAQEMQVDEAEADEPVVETDVDPYDQPLTETIGDEIAGGDVDRVALDEAVASDRDEA